MKVDHARFRKVADWARKRYEVDGVVNLVRKGELTPYALILNLATVKYLVVAYVQHGPTHKARHTKAVDLKITPKPATGRHTTRFMVKWGDRWRRVYKHWFYADQRFIKDGRKIIPVLIQGDFFSEG